jgi:heterotetrameric sarcosine oxidase gamma subunit
MVDALNPSSPLDDVLSLSLPRPTAALSVRAVPGLRVLSLRHLTGGSAAIDAAVAAHGPTPRPAPGSFCGADPLLVWTGPAELLLLTANSAVAEAVLQTLNPGREALAYALDQSAGCLVLELMGLGVSDVLPRLLDSSAVPLDVGEGSRTRLKDIGTVVLRLEKDRAWLVVDRAHSVYATKWISRALDAAPGPR